MVSLYLVDEKEQYIKECMQAIMSHSCNNYFYNGDLKDEKSFANTIERIQQNQGRERDIMINKAIIFATNAHSGMVRKGTSMPYILHPMEAGVIVSQMTTEPELIAAALLHDTVEDCDEISIEDIRQAFGEKVAQLVSAESEDKTKTWQERKSHTLEFLRNEATEEVKIVTLGDKLSNMRAIARDYKVLGDKLWNRFNVKDKERIGWYYKGLGDSLSSISRYQAYHEYIQLVGEVFK